MTMQELMTQRAKAWETCKNFLDAHRQENGLLSAEDDAAYNKMVADVDALTKEIKRVEDAMQREAALSAPTSVPLAAAPAATAVKDAYKVALIEAMRSRFTRFSNDLTKGVQTDGGYLVPEEMDEKLRVKLAEDNVMRKLANVISTESLIKINVAANSFAANWVAEGGALTWDSSNPFTQVELDAHKLKVAVKVSEELLADADYDLEGYLVDAFAQGIANQEENAFLNGDGQGKPYGVFHATKGGIVGVTTANNAKIAADEVIDLIYSVKPQYRKNAAFVMNDTTLCAIRKLKDNQGSYLWQPSLIAGEPDRLMGYPVYTSPAAPSIAADTPVMAFGNFKYFTIADRGSRTVNQLTELFAGNGQVGIVVTERVDGALTDRDAVKVMKMSV